MRYVGKSFIKGLLLSTLSCIVFICGMYFIARIRYLSHAAPASLLLFCVPLLFFSLRTNAATVKRLVVSSLVNCLWIGIPVSMMIGWFFTTFHFDEFDNNKLFNFRELLMYSSVMSIPIFIVTFVTLFIGGGITLLISKRKTRRKVSIKNERQH